MAEGSADGEEDENDEEDDDMRTSRADKRRIGYHQKIDSRAHLQMVVSEVSSASPARFQARQRQFVPTIGAKPTRAPS